MGRDENILHMPQCGFLRKGLFGCDIECRTRKTSSTKRLHQRVLVNQNASSHVDEVRVRFEVRQPFGVHQVMRPGRDRHGQHNEVAFL